MTDREVYEGLAKLRDEGLLRQESINVLDAAIAKFKPEPKLKPNRPVMWSEGIGIELVGRAEQIPNADTNIRPLFTIEEAAEVYELAPNRGVFEELLWALAYVQEEE